MKTLILTVLILLSFPALALRCGNDLIAIGDPYYKVITTCKIDYEYQVHNVEADIKKLYYKESGMNYELILIDGNLAEINQSIF